MNEEENRTEVPKAPKAPVSDLYPTAYKGALREDPTVQATPKKHWWQLFRRSDQDSFVSILWVIVVLVVFCAICLAVVLSLF